MTTQSGYKPSPLSYGSQRGSPFRRPDRSASPASSLRQSTPPSSPPWAGQSGGVGSRFANSATTTPTAESRTEGRAGTREQAPDVFSSPRRSTAETTVHPSMGYGNAISRLQPSQVRTLREGFQILDRDSDGTVNRDDVAEMLAQLGLPSSQTDVSHFFPPSTSQTISLAAFLNSVATSLAALSESTELSAAFAAFDEDDDGQIDVAELRDALLNTPPESGERPLTGAEVDKALSGFVGRRAFTKAKAGGKLGKRGEVFRYREFVNSLGGGNNGSEQGSGDSEDT